MAKLIIKCVVGFWIILFVLILLVLGWSCVIRQSVGLFWEYEGGRKSTVDPLKDLSGTRIYIDRKQNIVAVIIAEKPETKVRMMESSRHMAAFEVDDRRFVITGDRDTLTIIRNGQQGTFPIKGAQATEWHNGLYKAYLPGTASQRSILSDLLSRCDDSLKEQLTAFIERTKN